jgi:flagellar protein FlaF
MTLKAYQNTQRVVEDPRSTEYRLFGQITGALIDAQTRGITGVPLLDAVDWNRQVWTALASDCLDSANRLPEGLRAQIVSLSMWVAKYSKEVTRKGASLDPLISVNRSIMQGLNAG